MRQHWLLPVARSFAAKDALHTFIYCTGLAKVRAAQSTLIERQTAIPNTGEVSRRSSLRAFLQHLLASRTTSSECFTLILSVTLWSSRIRSSFSIFGIF